MKKTQAERVYEAAMAYRDKKFSVIPLREDKRPLIPWLEYQDRLPDYSELRGWTDRWPDMNIGIIKGHISRIIVMDLDGKEAEAVARNKGVPHTPIARTGKGTHIYMKMDPRKDWENKSWQENKIDIRANGGYVVAPPSIHPSGRHYQWTDWHPWNTKFSPPLPWMLDFMEDKGENGLKERGWQNDLLAGVSKGGRNHAAASLAGRLLTKGLTKNEVTEILLWWNEMKNKPPLPDYEVERTVESIAARDRRRN